MEGYGETSDTDSGIILHSGSDSPTVTTKDVTTHTRAMKLKHQSLQDSLQLCVLELKKLCIREAELTGKLSADYPLAPGEAPPKVRRRIGASFQLDEQSIPRGPKVSPQQGSPLTLVDAELALQLKIYEAARRLCREEHQNKAVRRSRLQQCKREEKRVKELQESAFQLRLQHGRSSPLPAFSIPFREHGHSDDSSLSDSPVVDEDVHPPPPSSGPACRDQNQLPQTFPVSSPSTADSAILSSPVASQPHTPVKRTPSQLTPIKRTLSQHTPVKRTPSLLTPSQLTPGQFTPGQFTPGQFTPGQFTPGQFTPGQFTTGQFTPRRAGSPGLDSMLSFCSNPESEAPPIQPSPWTESSLDQPFQKTKKSRSSTKSTASSPASSQVLPPLEACLGNPSLPQQLSQLQLSDRLANGTPPTPELRLHRNLSLRISNPETPPEERSRGRTRSARRRLTDCSVSTPETAGGNPADRHGTPENPADRYGTPENPADRYGTPENPAGHYGTPENPAGHYGTPENPAGRYGTPENPADRYGTPENPAGHYGTPENPADRHGTPENPAGHYGTPENPAGHYGTPENPADRHGTPENPAGHYGTPENPADRYGTPENPADRYGTPENPAGHYGTPENPAGHYGTPENPAGHYGTPGTTWVNSAGHSGPQETTRRYPAGHYGTPETTRRYPAGHYGPPETMRGYPAGHYGPPETMRGYPPYHYGPQENSEDSHSEHSFSTRSGSVCQEQQGEFPRARHLQHPGPTGGPGPHAFQGPALYQSPRYQSGPSFNPGHYPGDVAYALDLVRGYHGPRAPSNRRDCMYVEVPGPAMMAPRRAPQEVRLSRSPSLWEPQRYRSNGPPRQLVDDHLKSWHHRNQFREPRPRSLDRQGAVRVKTVPDWMSPLTHNQRYQEQVLKSRVQQQRLVDDGPGRWFGEDSKAVSLV